MPDLISEERLSELEAKWLNGTISDQEAEEYARWYNAQDNTPVIVNESDKEQHRIKMLAAIKAKMQQDNPKEHFIFKNWIKCAAAILLVLGAGSYLYLTNSFNKKQTSLANENSKENLIQPVNNSAILTLSDGRKIILEDSAGQTIVDGKTTISNSAGVLTYNTPSSPGTAVSYNTMLTPRGGQYNIRLPDGTMAWLNASSSIKFPTAFNGNERIVEMSGEVYFEVAKNSRQPFIVRVNNDISVEVLGTQFNVNAYEDESAIKTTLLEGSVNVKKKTAGAVKLAPGQQAVSMNNRNALEVNSDVDVEEIMAWKNGYFMFNRTDIKTVMRQVARWYDVEISYEGKVPNDRFVGKIPRNAPASQVFKVFEEMGIHFRVEGKKLIVTQ